MINLQLRPTRVKYPFFAIAAQRKNKRKKDTACGRGGTCEDGRKEIRPNKNKFISNGNLRKRLPDRLCHKQ